MKSPDSSKSSSSGSLPELSASDIHIPELERKEAAEKQAEQQRIHQANPQAPDSQGLNASGLPSAEVYYRKRKEPVHTSSITPIAQSRKWIRLISIAAYLIGFFWIKDAIDGLRFEIGTIKASLNAIKLVLTYFFFILPGYKLWKLTKEIDNLESERDEASVGNLLFAHAEIWKYGGLACGAGILFAFASHILPKFAPLFSI